VSLGYAALVIVSRKLTTMRSLRRSKERSTEIVHQSGYQPGVERSIELWKRLPTSRQTDVLHVHVHILVPPTSYPNMHIAGQECGHVGHV
jgi:hypothetical protein